MNDLLTLKVGVQIYGGWKSVNVRTGIEQVSGIFELAITERWPEQTTDWNIPPGETCQISIGDDVVISGYVDAVGVNFDARDHQIKVSGRDAAGDLVDCTAATQSFSRLKFAQIAEILCKPFGVSVHDETVLGRKLTSKQIKAGLRSDPPKSKRAPYALPKLAVQPGETVFKTLEKIARSEGVLLVSDGEGGIVITRAGLGGDAGTVLEFGKNILTASYEHSHANLFSQITVLGQTSASFETLFEANSCSPKAVVVRAKSVQQNSEITRHRPLIILAERQSDAKRCKQRAEWEAGNREAKARRVSVSVQGWRQEDGSLWRINQMVKVKCPWARSDEKWLIAGVNYLLDESGTISQLTLVSEKAFDVLPEIPAPKPGAASGKTQVVGDKEYQKIQAANRVGNR